MCPVGRRQCVAGELAARAPHRVGPTYLGLGQVVAGAGSGIRAGHDTPVAPLGTGWFDAAAGLNGISVEMVGWPELVQQIADIYHSLPPEEQARTAIVSGNYGEAGALELYGPSQGLPPGPPHQVTGSNSLWARGYGAPPPEMVLLVGFDRDYAMRFFGMCSPKGTVTNPWGVENEETTDHTSLYLCRKVLRPWAEFWPEMQWFQ